MRGYLLDTNIVSYWFDGSCLQNKNIAAHVARLPKGTPLAISAITLGEIEFGLRVRPAELLRFEAELQKFLFDLPLVLDVTSPTSTVFLVIRRKGGGLAEAFVTTPGGPPPRS